MEYRRKYSRTDDKDRDDSPIYSRLFVLRDRAVKEDQLREIFSEFGTIEDIRIPRNPNNGELKRVAFIKFSKTSEAAIALEAMNAKMIPNANRPLKIKVATNRTDIESGEEYNSEKYKRLFLNISKEVNEEILQEHFKQFGHIEDILIQRDRDTGESKGFAYIKYGKFSEAAKAFENCDRKYRAIFAQPKGFSKRTETTFETNINNLATSNHGTSLLSMMKVNPKGYTKVIFKCSPFLTQMHVESLFDIVPGLVNCQYFVDLIRNFGSGTAYYSNPISAAYAVQKLNGFEYPPGCKFFVRPQNNSPYENNMPNISSAVNNLRNAIAATNNSSSPDLAQLTAAIAEASKLVKMATGGVCDDGIPDSNDLNYCSVSLPPPQPLAHIDSPVAKRCFLVCKPQPPPLTVLRDIFCRFGNLINVYTLPNKTVGYARYSVSESADEAIKILHGAEICGVRMKVLEAEAEVPPKRRRIEDDYTTDIM